MTAPHRESRGGDFSTPKLLAVSTFRTNHLGFKAPALKQGRGEMWGDRGVTGDGSPVTFFLSPLMLKVYIRRAQPTREKR
jgi:hypothetical protein